ncbi:hypothetical protein DNTS_004872 [Danionella cerebrum]|uniref:SUN domain-containing protein n=1 Tax=Danionella cerebrum TaxID=2873325 RepID=A0A553NGQ6_9TELE|nr:hypothetical protein DNTS_004872 [Danionella translucida]
MERKGDGEEKEKERRMEGRRREKGDRGTHVEKLQHDELWVKAQDHCHEFEGGREEGTLKSPLSFPVEARRSLLFRSGQRSLWSRRRITKAPRSQQVRENESVKEERRKTNKQTRGKGQVSQRLLPEPQKKTNRHVFTNYASVECGAKILRSNPEAKSTSAILMENRDVYMLNPCNNKIWFIVELCQYVQLQQFDLANFEIFSSNPRDIRLSSADRYPSKQWVNVGRFLARDERTVQSFTLNQQRFTKYIKEHHRNRETSERAERFASRNSRRDHKEQVFGTSMMEEYEMTSGTHEDQDLDLPADTVLINDGLSRNLIGSAKNALLSVVNSLASNVISADPEMTAEQPGNCSSEELKNTGTPSLLETTSFARSEAMDESASEQSTEFTKTSIGLLVEESGTEARSCPEKDGPVAQQIATLLLAEPATEPERVAEHDQKPTQAEPDPASEEIQSLATWVELDPVQEAQMEVETNAEPETTVQEQRQNHTTNAEMNAAIEVEIDQLSSGELEPVIEAERNLVSQPELDHSESNQWSRLENLDSLDSDYHSFLLQRCSIDYNQLKTKPQSPISSATKSRIPEGQTSFVPRVHSIQDSSTRLSENREKLRIVGNNVHEMQNRKKTPIEKKLPEIIGKTLLGMSNEEKKGSESSFITSDQASLVSSTLFMNLQSESSVSELESEPLANIWTVSSYADKSKHSEPLNVEDRGLTANHRSSGAHPDLQNSVRALINQESSEQNSSSSFLDPQSFKKNASGAQVNSGQRESVFMRFGNRIKLLETNMSLSGRYLEQLSQRDKEKDQKQSELIQDLQVEVCEKQYYLLMCLFLCVLIGLIFVTKTDHSDSSKREPCVNLRRRASDPLPLRFAEGGPMSLEQPERSSFRKRVMSFTHHTLLNILNFVLLPGTLIQNYF